MIGIIAFFVNVSILSFLINVILGIVISSASLLAFMIVFTFLGSLLEHLKRNNEHLERNNNEMSETLADAKKLINQLSGEHPAEH